MKCEGMNGVVFRPYLPITLSFGAKRFPVGRALVDTGADVTLLPVDVARYLGIALEEEAGIRIGSAGGGEFLALPSCERVGFSIDMPGFRPCQWRGRAYFAPR